MQPSRDFEPNYVDFFSDSYQYLVRAIHYHQNNSYFSTKFRHDLALISNQIHIFDVLLVALLSVGLTVARHIATNHFFQPVTKWCGIHKSDAQKIPESAWKLLFYLSTWCTSYYYLFVQHRGLYFRQPTMVWHNYSLDSPIEPLIYWIYMVELSFYIHSLYTTLLVDQRRKDTNTLMFHHVVCILLIAISYCNKSHRSGLLTLFFHDGCDVVLEATKLLRYFKVQHGRCYHNVEIFVNIGFASFLLIWLSNRLYWFPLKQVYIASIYVEAKQIQVPFISLLILLLWVILLMNFYWFTFALRLLYKVATGQIKELEDNREYKDNTAEPEVEQEKSVRCGKEEGRKMSVDSGVALAHSDESSESGSEWATSRTYNLRQRRDTPARTSQ